MRPSALLASAATLLLGAACQQQPATQTLSATAPASAPEATTGAVAVAATKAVPLAATERKFLADYNLANLLVMEESAGYELMNGFFGPDHYRIEFAMLDVQQDPTNPAHFFLKGKNRFKKNILPFEGDMTITQLRNQPKMVVTEDDDNAELQKYVTKRNQLTMYCATGNFRLRENSSAKGAGTFAGTVALDVEVNEEGNLQLSTRNRNYGARGGSVLFEGAWTSQATRQQKALVLVKNIMSYDQNILDDFMVGEREPGFNPKYAKLGWDTYWENEEWWAEPGQMPAPAAEVQQVAAEQTDQDTTAESL
jgi:hypothetical protein